MKKNENNKLILKFPPAQLGIVEISVEDSIRVTVRDSFRWALVSLFGALQRWIGSLFFLVTTS